MSLNKGTFEGLKTYKGGDASKIVCLFRIQKEINQKHKKGGKK